jgi:hypothetical protein
MSTQPPEYPRAPILRGGNDEHAHRQLYDRHAVGDDDQPDDTAPPPT